MAPMLPPVDAVNDESVIDVVDVRYTPPSVVPELEVKVQRSKSVGVVLYTAPPVPPTWPSNVESATSVSWLLLGLIRIAPPKGDVLDTNDDARMNDGAEEK